MRSTVKSALDAKMSNGQNPSSFTAAITAPEVVRVEQADQKSFQWVIKYLTLFKSLHIFVTDSNSGLAPSDLLQISQYIPAFLCSGTESLSQLQTRLTAEGLLVSELNQLIECIDLETCAHDRKLAPKQFQSLAADEAVKAPLPFLRLNPLKRTSSFRDYSPHIDTEKASSFKEDTHYTENACSTPTSHFGSSASTVASSTHDWESSSSRSYSCSSSRPDKKEAQAPKKRFAWKDARVTIDDEESDCESEEGDQTP